MSEISDLIARPNAATSPCEHDASQRVADCHDCWEKWICVCGSDAYYIDQTKCCRGCGRSSRLCQCGDPIEPEDV